MISKNQIKEIQYLHLKKQRDERRLFIAEGIKTINEMVNTCPECIKQVFATEEYLKNFGSDLNEKSLVYFPVTADELKKISLQSTPNQVIAVCDYFDEVSLEKVVTPDFTFYLDNVRDPGNFGTILRLADWYGISAVYCSPTSCDFYNPKVVQSTMGAFLRVKVVYCSLKSLREINASMPIYGAVLDGNNLYNEQLQKGVIVIGNEANGIDSANLKLLTHRLTIPSSKGSVTESLNAAMASAILASEFFRQLKNAMNK